SYGSPPADPDEVTLRRPDAPRGKAPTHLPASQPLRPKTPSPDPSASGSGISIPRTQSGRPKTPSPSPSGSGSMPAARPKTASNPGVSIARTISQSSGVPPVREYSEGSDRVRQSIDT